MIATLFGSFKAGFALESYKIQRSKYNSVLRETKQVCSHWGLGRTFFILLLDLIKNGDAQNLRCVGLH